MIQLFASPIVKPQFTVEAVIIKACANCGAKGVDDKNQPVGDICPNCGAPRPQDIDKGIIYANTLWFKFKRKINKLLGRE